MKELATKASFQSFIVILIVLGFFPPLFTNFQFDLIAKLDLDSESACQSCVSAQGKYNSDALEKLIEIADYCTENGGDEQAVPILKQIHKLQSKKFGPKNKEAVETLNLLAGQFVVLKQYGEGLSLYWRIYKIQEEILGPTHSETLFTLRNLAHVYHKKGKYEKAMGLFKIVYKQRKTVFGTKHTATMEVLFLLGNSLEKADQSPETKEKVLKYYEQVYKVYSENLGETDETLSVLSAMGKCLMALKRFEKAVPIFQTIIMHKNLQLDSDLDSDSEASSGTENLLGWSLIQLGRMEEARAVYHEAERSNSNMGEKAKEFDNSERKISSALNIAKVAMAKGNYEEAFKKIHGLDSVIQSNHAKTQEILEALVKVHVALNNFTKAFEISIQLFRVVQNKSKSESGSKCPGHPQKIRLSIASAWDVVFNQFRIILEKHPKLDPEEEILLPKFFKIVDFVVTNLRHNKYVNDDDDWDSQADENPNVLKALAMAAFLAEEQEIGKRTAAKLVRILERQKESNGKSKRSEIDKEKQRSGINKEMKIFQKILSDKTLWGGEKSQNKNEIL